MVREAEGQVMSEGAMNKDIEGAAYLGLGLGQAWVEFLWEETKAESDSLGRGVGPATLFLKRQGRAKAGSPKTIKCLTHPKIFTN